MAAYLRVVWDPNGVIFEVPHEKASDLILNHGWSNTDPALRVVKKGKKSSTKATDDAPVADTTEVFTSTELDGPADATSE